MNISAVAIATVLILGVRFQTATAQTPPSPSEVRAYEGLHAAAYSGDTDRIRQLMPSEANLDRRDGAGRTPMIVAAFQSHDAVVQLLAEAGADPNALEDAKYDIITIAAVANDVDLVKLALQLGGKSGNVTSRYEGTALIAAAHLGHDAVVRILIKAGAPLNHVNNLGWTALIEAVILGDGGPRHRQTVKALVEAGADVNIPDRGGVTPLAHAQTRGYTEIAALIEAATE